MECPEARGKSLQLPVAENTKITWIYLLFLLENRLTSKQAKENSLKLVEMTYFIHLIYGSEGNS